MGRGAILIALAASLLVGGLLWLYLDKVFSIRNLSREIAALRERRRELRARIEALRYVLEHKRELQELAIRVKLRYGLPGEVVVLFEGGR